MASSSKQHQQQQQQHGKGRRLVDIAQKARGCTPLLYELEVIPFFAGACGGAVIKLAGCS